MGMDVYGKNPTTEEGECFRNNIGHWHPLAEYVGEIAPDIAGKCRHWHTNDGDGLDAADVRKLADILQAEIDSGRCEHYARIYASAQERTPNESCWLCAGTGTRKPAPEVGAGGLVTGIVCNGCKGEGWFRPWSTRDRFSVENVQNFIVFLRDCGGFEIW